MRINANYKPEPIGYNAVERDPARLQLKGFRKWKLRELALNLLPVDRQSGSQGPYGSIRFFRHLIRHWFKVPA